jgi:membrane protein implicated in regulation of membrane protease activity
MLFAAVVARLAVPFGDACAVLLIAAFASLFFLPEPWGYVAVAVAAVVEVGEVYFWIRFLRRYRVTTGAEGLVGERAEVVEALDPAGRVRVRGELWAARAAQPAIAGQRVRVTAVDGLTLEVEPD